MNASYKIAERHSKFINQISFFLLVKKTYSRYSVVRNYTPYTLSKRLSMHHKTVDRYVKKLLKLGLVTFKDKDLIFRNQKKIGGKSFYFPIKSLSIKAIALELQSTIIDTNRKQQEYKILKNVESLDHSAYPIKLNGEKIPFHETRIFGTPIFTLHSLSNHLGCSSPTVARVLNDLNFKRIPKWVKTNLPLSCMNREFIKSHPGRYKIRNKKVYRLYGFNLKYNLDRVPTFHEHRTRVKLRKVLPALYNVMSPNITYNSVYDTNLETVKESEKLKKRKYKGAKALLEGKIEDTKNCAG